MLFAHDTEVSLGFAAALVNTAPGISDPERLTDVAAMDEFVNSWDFTGARRHDVAELQAVRDLRPRLREVWERDKDGVVDLVNGLLAQFNALPQLRKHDEWDYHLHATTPDAPLAARMAVEVAMALVDVVRMDELGRLRICANDDCSDVLVDLSRNRSKRYCDLTCSNLASVRAYRARAETRSSGPGDA